MILMPANASGWIWHSLARETGRIGHLYSPGGQRGPWPWLPYAIDNGCFSLWNPDDNTFDEDGWKSRGEDAWRRLLFWCEAAEIKPLWSVVPDRPGNWDETLAKWEAYAPSVLFKRAVAVQDGATVEAVKRLTPKPDVIAVGGSTEWKWATAETWLANFEHVHVLRCNSPTRLHWLEERGAKSADGTGWNRGDRHIRTRALEEWARCGGKPRFDFIWPHVSRKRNADQLYFA